MTGKKLNSNRNCMLCIAQISESNTWTLCIRLFLIRNETPTSRMLIKFDFLKNWIFFLNKLSSLTLVINQIWMTNFSNQIFKQIKEAFFIEFFFSNFFSRLFYYFFFFSNKNQLTMLYQFTYFGMFLSSIWKYN